VTDGEAWPLAGPLPRSGPTFAPTAPALLTLFPLLRALMHISDSVRQPCTTLRLSPDLTHVIPRKCCVPLQDMASRRRWRLAAVWSTVWSTSSVKSVGAPEHCGWERASVSGAVTDRTRRRGGGVGSGMRSVWAAPAAHHSGKSYGRRAADAHRRLVQPLPGVSPSTRTGGRQVLRWPRRCTAESAQVATG